MGRCLRHRPGGAGLTAGAVTQECTRIGGNGLSAPFRGIRVHCCNVVDNRGYAGVYTDRLKRPLGAVSGHLCTLLQREDRASSRVGVQECTQIGGNGLSAPFWGTCVHCCDAIRRGVNPHEPPKSPFLREIDSVTLTQIRSCTSHGKAHSGVGASRKGTLCVTARMQNAPFGAVARSECGFP